MKRFIATFVAAILLLSLSGCSSKSAGDLIGLWSGSWEYNGEIINQTILFEVNGSYARATYKDGTLSSTETGTYELDRNKVFCYIDGNKGHFTEYKFNGDSLKNNGHLITKVGDTAIESTSIKKVEYFDEFSKLPTPDSLFDEINYAFIRDGTKVYTVDKPSAEAAAVVFLEYLVECENYGFEWEETTEDRIYWLKYNSEQVCLTGFTNDYGTYYVVFYFA